MPGKNLREVGGKSLLARAVDTCWKSGLQAVVSTDCTFIASAAVQYGARVRMREASLATDNATSWEVLRSVAALFPEWSTIVWAQCTAPLMTPGDIEGCVSQLERGDLAVCVHKSHILELNEHCYPCFPVPAKPRQLMAPRYVISGSVWAFRREYLMERECYSGIVVPVLSEHPYRLDIDTLDDLRAAQAILEGA